MRTIFEHHCSAATAENRLLAWKYGYFWPPDSLSPTSVGTGFSYMQRHNCNAMVHGLQCDSIMQMKPVPA
jgi:hypothetical protein